LLPSKYNSYGLLEWALSFERRVARKTTRLHELVTREGGIPNCKMNLIIARSLKPSWTRSAKIWICRLKRRRVSSFPCSHRLSFRIFLTRHPTLKQSANCSVKVSSFATSQCSAAILSSRHWSQRWTKPSISFSCSRNNILRILLMYKIRNKQSHRISINSSSETNNNDCKNNSNNMNAKKKKNSRTVLFRVSAR
jgi:hypothetical protein